MSDNYEAEQRLIFEGFGALEIADFERALRAARELHQYDNMAAYEIEARARWEMDDRDRAIEVLQRGVQVAPDMFILWDYLGSYLSDEERFEEALQAYYASRECEDAPHDAVDFNIAIVYQRQDRHERAIAMLETIAASENVPSEVLVGARAYSLNETGKHADAMTLTAACLNKTGEDDEVDPEAIARVMSEHAYGLWMMGLAEAAYEEAYESVALDKSNQRAAWLIREIADDKSPDSKIWRIVVEGRWGQPFEDNDKDYGFYANYMVVAESADEALDYIRYFEPEEVRFTLKINSAVDVEPQPDLPKGIYDADAAYQFFPLDEK